MQAPKTLVVFYSRSGTTREVARELASRLHADIDEIIDRTPREGLVGYFRAGFDAFFHRRTELQPTTRDPEGYELVVLATPIWNTSVSAPMRAYLRKTFGRYRHVAFVVTHDHVGSRRVLRQMARLSFRRPCATLALRRAEVEARSHLSKLDAFVDRLGRAVAASHVDEAQPSQPFGAGRPVPV